MFKPDFFDGDDTMDIILDMTNFFLSSVCFSLLPNDVAWDNNVYFVHVGYAKEQERVHTARSYIEISSDYLSFMSSYDSLTTSSDDLSDSGTRQKPNKHLTYYIKLNP